MGNHCGSNCCSSDDGDGRTPANRSTPRKKRPAPSRSPLTSPLPSKTGSYASLEPQLTLAASEPLPSGSYQHAVRITVEGDVRVGKTFFVSSMVGQALPAAYIPTEDSNSHAFELHKIQGVHVKACWMELPRDQRFYTSNARSICGSHVRVILYDVTHEPSFLSAKARFLKHTARCPVFLIGTKEDSTTRAVEPQSIANFCARAGLNWVETSAMRGTATIWNSCSDVAELSSLIVRSALQCKLAQSNQSDKRPTRRRRAASEPVHRWLGVDVDVTASNVTRDDNKP